MKLKEINFKDYLISNDRSILSLDKIHQLLSQSYWANKRPREKIAESINNSECFGVYLNGEQVGFARIVTDYAVMYWLCDVVIDEAHRKKGLGKKLIETIVNDETFSTLTGILGTMDAYSLYEKFGFTRDSLRFMRRKIT